MMTGVTILTFGVLWNIDVGAISLASYIISACLVSALGKTLTRDLVWGVCKKILLSAFVFLVIFVLIAIYLKTRYNSWPHLSWILEFQHMFVGIAVNLHLKQYNFWIAIIAIYVTGLAYASQKFISKKASKHHLIIIFLTLLGIGLFSYHAGNGWPQVIGPCGYPAILIILIFIDSVLDGKKFPYNRENNTAKLTDARNYIVVFFIAFFCFFSTVYFLNFNKP
jgi:hypothetical protein